MDAPTVRSIQGQVLDRLAEEKTITVLCGEMFARNLQREFKLLHINRNRLQEAVDVGWKSGLIARQEVRLGNDGEGHSGATAQRRDSARRMRIYTLTELGRKQRVALS